MKSFKVVLMFLVIIFVFSIRVEAKCQDNGENISTNIKKTYNCDTKELSLYGKDFFGSFGTGKINNEVSPKDPVVVNKLIGGKKIIDYYIGGTSTYVLTEDNIVYASGKSIADSNAGSSIVFTKVHFYRNKLNKVVNLKSKQIEKDGEIIYFKTQNKNIYYSFMASEPMVVCFSSSSEKVKNDVSSKFYIATPDIYKSGISTVYNEKKSSNLKYEIISDRSDNVRYKLTKMKKKEVYNYYKNKQIFFKIIIEPQIERYYTYKNNKLTKKISYWIKKNIDTKTVYKNNKRVYYETRKNVIKNNQYYIKTKTKYWYKKNKLNQRKVYKLNKKNKLRLYSKKEYKYRKSGKHYNYITYYKSGKAVSTYKYELNKKGKVVLKKKVRKR